jgi:hypothetical protein
MMLTGNDDGGCRMMNDEDGPSVARWFYERLFALDLDTIAYALDVAVTKLREIGVPASRWALFIHIGGCSRGALTAALSRYQSHVQQATGLLALRRSIHNKYFELEGSMHVTSNSRGCIGP